MSETITYRTDKAVSPSAVRGLFRRNRWYDWFSVDDTAWYLRRALFVASAWHGRRAVGLAVLTGDGRISVELATLLVDEKYRRRGIGELLLERAVKKAEALGPYYFSVAVFEERTERLYARQGFQRNKSTWLLEHRELADRLVKKVKRIRRGQPKRKRRRI